MTTTGPMEYRRHGHAGPEVSALALGSWHTWDRAKFEEAVDVVKIAVDRGMNFFDVGVYRSRDPQQPDSPTDLIFSHIMRIAGISRDQYVMSIKIWLHPGEGSAERHRQLDDALYRYGTDDADGFVLGDILEPEFDLQALVSDIGAWIRAGKVRWWGVNNWSAQETAAVAAEADRQGVPAPTVAQLRYSLARRSIPEGQPFTDLLADRDIAIQASDVLEGGFLAGQRGPARVIAGDPGGLRRQIRDLAPRIAEIADGFGATPAQLALAFPLTNPRVSNVLFGARTREQIRDNLGAIDLQREHGAELRAMVDELWLDRDVVSPEASWGARPDDDLAGYKVARGDAPLVGDTAAA